MESILKFNKVYIIDRVKLFYGKNYRKSVKFVSLILFNVFIINIKWWFKKLNKTHLSVLILSKTFDICGDGADQHVLIQLFLKSRCCLNSYTYCSSGDYSCNELNEYNKIFKVKSVSSYKIEIPEYIILIDAALNQLDFYDYFP